MNFLSVGLAVLAACCNGASNVLERKANLQMQTRQALSVRLMWRLLHSPLWLLGLVTVTASFVLQAAALDAGTLAAVQPIIILELPITLLAGGIFLGGTLRRREWGAIAAMTGGLAALLVGLDPRAGTSAASIGATTWAIGLPATLAAVVVLVLLARRVQGPLRAVLLGSATGIEFGMTAALMKGMTNALSGGFAHVLGTWQTYAMIVAGVGGMVLMQNSLQAGRLVAAQPGITLLDPMTAIAWGIVAFHERVNGGLWIVAAGAGALCMAGGALLLSQAPALQKAHGKDHEHDAGGGDAEAASGETGSEAPARSGGPATKGVGAA